MHEPETPRLRFRRFTPNDLHALAAIRADADVMKYIGAGRPESIEEAQLVLNKLMAHWSRHGFGPWALVDKTDQNLIGWCGLKYLEQTADVEIAYGLAKCYWGNGLATEGPLQR